MQYDLLLFDADDTLLDFKRSEAISFQAVLKKNELIFSEELYTNYKKINQELWANEAKGLITKDFLKVERFKKFLAAHSLKGDAEKMSDDYLNELPEQVFLVEEADFLLNSLYQKVPLVIVTNGIGQVQHKRLKISGLEPLIKLMIVSEECGHSKPDPRIFQHTMKRLNETFEMNRILMIGDKLETDILGANNFGIDSCWFNPEDVKNTSTIKPTYEIKNLKSLLEIVC